MPRQLDIATQDAISNTSQIIVRNFVLCRVRGEGGQAEFFGFTDFGEDVITNIVDGETGQTVSRTYYGDNGPIVKMDPIPMRIGLEVATTQIVLNHLHPVVELMARGRDCRNAAVQIHRGYLDPDSMLLVAPPRIRRLGQINGMPITTPPAEGEGNIVLKIVSTTRSLTLTSPALRSYETLLSSRGDHGRRYVGTGYKWPIHWGEAKA